MTCFCPLPLSLLRKSAAAFCRKCRIFSRKVLPLPAAALLLLSGGGCQDDPGAGGGGGKLVVEGWIEEGGFPVVLVSRTAVPQEEPQAAEDLVVRWAKVVVSDGTREEVLTGRYDEDYFPPYVYTGSRLRGEAGRTYRLTVGEGGDTVSATTAIPLHAPDCSGVRAEAVDGAEGLYEVRISFRTPEQGEEWYKIFVQDPLSGSRRFYPSFMGTFSSSGLPREAEASALRGSYALAGTEDDEAGMYFSGGTYARVKFACIGRVEYEFWARYETAVGSNSNVFLSTQQNLPGNVAGGKGCWYGMNGREWVVWFP